MKINHHFYFVFNMIYKIDKMNFDIKIILLIIQLSVIY